MRCLKLRLIDRYYQQPGERPEETNGEAAPTPDEEEERMEREYESSAAESVTKLHTYS